MAANHRASNNCSQGSLSRGPIAWELAFRWAHRRRSASTGRLSHLGRAWLGVDVNSVLAIAGIASSRNRAESLAGHAAAVFAVSGEVRRVEAVELEAAATHVPVFKFWRVASFRG